MKRRRIVARFCAFTLAASLVFLDALPAFAAAVSEEPMVDWMQAEEENFSDEAVASTEDTGVENIEGTEMVKETEPESETEMSDVTEKEPEIVPVPSTEENQETLPDEQEKNDALIYVADTLYTGYYMDGAGILYIVSNGVAESVNGIVGEGTKYYSFNDVGILTLSMQTLYVKGEIYSGYYMDSANKMYNVKKGVPTLKTGTVKKGTKYYNYNTKTDNALSKQTLYVKGKVYNGYYMDNKSKMYSVKKGTRTLKTGVVKKGTKYYNYNTKKTKTLSKQTLYVKGKVYNGYYMDSKNKMYSVKKGALALMTGMVKKGAKYYASKSKKTKKLSKWGLYVDGKVYNGYYLGSDDQMYTISNKTYTPVNTMLNAGTAYFSCKENKMLTLPGQMIYVYGKAMEWMNPDQMAALQKAQSVVQSVSEQTDSKEEKLYKCYLWMEKFPYKRYHIMKVLMMSYPETWDVIFANDIFEAYSGCCASEACAFAYMAKACGYENVTICSDGGHTWVDIDGRLYDPLFAEARSFSENYNAAYTDYRIRPVYKKTL